MSDVTGLSQNVPTQTIGASLGAAFLAARSLGPADITTWNPIARVVEPSPEREDGYAELYGLYRELYENTATISHTLAKRQRATQED